MRTPDKVALVLATAAAVVLAGVQYGYVGKLAAEAVAARAEDVPAYTGTGLDHELVTFSDDEELPLPVPEKVSAAPPERATAARTPEEEAMLRRAMGEAQEADEDYSTSDPALLL